VDRPAKAAAERLSAVLPFEFLIAGTPVSQQTRRRARLRAWIDQVRRQVDGHWQGKGTEDGSIALRLTYLHRGGAGDLDNLAKPVLDALKGLVLDDDGQVTDLILRKRSLSAVLRIENPSPLLSSRFELGMPFLHVLVEIAPDQELVP
jgi:Holliday junction resolvase RusA-like endonuclease